VIESSGEAEIRGRAPGRCVVRRRCFCEAARLLRGQAAMPGLALCYVFEWALEPHSLWLGVQGTLCFFLGWSIMGRVEVCALSLPAVQRTTFGRRAASRRRRRSWSVVRTRLTPPHPHCARCLQFQPTTGSSTASLAPVP
jgi:hypothetical protein